MHMPRYLIEASYGHEGVEGVRTKDGSRPARTVTTVLLIPEKVDDAAKRSRDAVRVARH
jgi:hypothetical protein